VRGETHARVIKPAMVATKHRIAMKNARRRASCRGAFTNPVLAGPCAHKRRKREVAVAVATCAVASSAVVARIPRTRQSKLTIVACVCMYLYARLHIGKRHFRTPSPTDGPRTPGDARFYIASSLPRRPVIPELPCGWSFDARRAKGCRMQRTHARRV
jgi:hypothetical protein